jgi:CheY-like chemotaxis protein
MADESIASSQPWLGWVGANNTLFMNKTKLLLADDDPFFQSLIGGLLSADYEIIIVPDGTEAWRELQKPEAPRLAILDWIMPGFSGPQICRKVRASSNLSSTYLILLTARNNESDIVSGLRSGADDYITKPPMPAELRARIKMGERVLALQDAVKKSALQSSRYAPLEGCDGLTAESSSLGNNCTIHPADPACKLIFSRTGDSHDCPITSDLNPPVVSRHRRS